MSQRFLRTENEAHFIAIRKYVLSSFAMEKLFKEILPRLENVAGDPINVRKLPKRRKGDNATVGYIEIVGNEIERYEKAMKKEQADNSLVPNKKTWHIKV